MTSQFYNRFKNYSKEELFRIVLTPEEFQPDAIITAKQIINEYGWTNDLDILLKEKQTKDLEEENLLNQDIKEKAEYYKNVVAFKNDNYSFQVRIADIPKFEAALYEKGIEFFREDKYIGVQLDIYPTQTYFFKKKDAAKVDEITKNIGLITAPYTDIKPFFKFEVKVVLIAITLIILLFALLK